MKKTDKIKKKITDYLYDHYLFALILKNAKTLFLCLLAAIIFAFGYTCFITPHNESEGLTIVTGGCSGISQNIILILEILHVKFDVYTVSSILYTLINVPICLFGFFCVGKKFSIYSLINVIASSLFISFFPKVGISTAIASNTLVMDHDLVRVVFAGVCTGLSSALAFKGGLSCGGIDVFAYYFSNKKSSGVGIYAYIINGIIVLIHSILLSVYTPNRWSEAVIATLFSLVYLFICSLIVDSINVRNKKVQVQMISQNEHLSEILVAFFPHSATILKGKGAYSGVEKNVIYMVVSSSELKKVCMVAKKVDEHVFIVASPITKVFGNFYIKPVE